MSLGYELVFSLPVHEALLAARSRSRLEVMQSLVALRAAPNTPGDFTERDDCGRRLQVLALRDHALTYWTEHAVREVRIVKLERLGS